MLCASVILINSAVLKKLTVHHCSCVSLPVRLLQLGVFPCSPFKPTLAMDLKMLEHVKALFL